MHRETVLDPRRTAVTLNMEHAAIVLVGVWSVLSLGCWQYWRAEVQITHCQDYF